MAFSDLEKIEIQHIKEEGEKAFLGLGNILKFYLYHDNTQLEQIFLKHVVVTGGMFASLLQGEKVKDIDIYFLDYDKFLNELEEHDYRYLKEMILAAGKSYVQGKGHLYSLDKKIVDVFNITDTKYQIMTTDHTSREDMISNFDYKHTTISWYNGKLYLTEKTYRAAKGKLLIPNKKEAVTEIRRQKFLERGYKEVADVPSVDLIVNPNPYSGVTYSLGAGVVHIPHTGPSNGNGIVATGGGGSGASKLSHEDYIKKLEEYMKQQIDDANIAAGTYKLGSYKDNHYQQILHDILQEQAKKLFVSTNSMTNTSNVNPVYENYDDPWIDDLITEWGKTK